MRKSLSVSTLVLLSAALLGSFALAAAALVDQLGTQALLDHAREAYAPHGVEVSAGVIYGLLYTVAALQALLWLLVLGSARAGGRRAAVYAVGVVVLGAAAAVTLFALREYGEQVYPPRWGLLALLPSVIGVAAVATMRSEPGPGG